MTRILWNAPGERRYETGVDRGVIYPKAGIGVPWNGLTRVTDKKDGRTPVPKYIDGFKVDETAPTGDFSASVSAFTYPDILSKYEGLQDIGDGLQIDNQVRERFNFTYRTLIGNELDGPDHGYKIHLVYNALVTPEEVDSETINKDPEAAPFEWELTTIPTRIEGFRPTAHFIINSLRTDPYVLAEIENMLYGSADRDPTMPEANDFMDILAGWADLLVYDHGDGIYTAYSTRDAITRFTDGSFEITSDSAVNLENGEFTLTSL